MTPEKILSNCTPEALAQLAEEFAEQLNVAPKGGLSEVRLALTQRIDREFAAAREKLAHPGLLDQAVQQVTRVVSPKRRKS